MDKEFQNFVPRAEIGLNSALQVIAKQFWIDDMTESVFKDIVTAFLIGNGYDYGDAKHLANCHAVESFLNRAQQ